MELAPAANPGAAIGMLSALLLLAWVVIDRWQRQPDPAWSNDGIPLLAWYALGALGLAGLLAWCSRPRPAFAATLVLVLAVAPAPLALMAVGTYVLPGRIWWVAAAAVAVYGAVFVARGLAALTGRSQRLGALLAVLVVGAFIHASDRTNAIPDVWNPREADAPAADAPADEADVADREAALFEQADRIEAALEPISRDDAPRSEGFFLGFAGVGEQKVFAQEIALAARVIGERFDIGNRGLSLVNDQRDLDREPIASVSGLRYALAGLAERMDLDTDVLFLAISSHGSQDPAIVVSNPGIPLAALTPQELADALNQARIQWRVIVISACYAGGFIDALRDARTVVIAASAPDRTSFGCANDSDLTYFGEAFYRDALPQAHSLRAAFELAKAAIAARETREGVTPSNPQAYFGSEIEPRLKAWDQRGTRYTARLPR